MKKLISIALIIALMIVGLIVLTGCGTNETLAAVAGTYKGEYTKLVGDDSKEESEEFSVVLNADGTGTSNRDGASYNLTWSLEGENFKMTEKFAGMSIDYTGTLKEGKLDIFNGDPTNDFTYEYVYNKQ